MKPWGLRRAAILAALVALPALAACGEPATPDAEEQKALDNALIGAAWKGNVPEAQRLIERGANVNARDETSHSAYLIAAAQGDVDLLRLTLNNGADVDSVDKWNGTGLTRAAELGHVEVVRRLLQTDIELDHTDHNGNTALHLAILLGCDEKRHTEVVRLLIDAGADVNFPGTSDGTPLSVARERRCTTMAAILEAAGGR